MYIPDGDLRIPDGDLCIPDGDLCIPDGDLCIPDGDLCIPDGDLCIPDGDRLHPRWGSVISPMGIRPKKKIPPPPLPLANFLGRHIYDVFVELHFYFTV